MPTTHRIARFRDDIVFFAYLYQVRNQLASLTVVYSYKLQRYLYPVDKSRINEFGFSAEDEDKKPEIESDSDNSTVEDEVKRDAGDMEDKKTK